MIAEMIHTGIQVVVMLLSCALLLRARRHSARLYATVHSYRRLPTRSHVGKPAGFDR